MASGWRSWPGRKVSFGVRLWSEGCSEAFVTGAQSVVESLVQRLEIYSGWGGFDLLPIPIKYFSQIPTLEMLGSNDKFASYFSLAKFS